MFTLFLHGGPLDIFRERVLVLPAKVGPLTLFFFCSFWNERNHSTNIPSFPNQEGQGELQGENQQ